MQDRIHVFPISALGINHPANCPARVQKDTKLRPQQTGANLVFLSARPEMYKVGQPAACWRREIFYNNQVTLARLAATH